VSCGLFCIQPDGVDSSINLLVDAFFGQPFSCKFGTKSGHYNSVCENLRVRLEVRVVGDSPRALAACTWQCSLRAALRSL